MLQLTDIKKSYTTGEFTQVALNQVTINFRESEFVAILGQSGSGKTTLLNIIGGLDQYDSGDLVINGKSTKEFKAGEWDAYRNNSVGFIFQSYNLINHLSILDNVEMGMTLSGVKKAEKKANALAVLERVGLKEHIHKRPNQLSGGQMQRVAIARALANDPDIILADEPTGALDSETSEQIMALIKEIAEDKLVIMVTHNPELAENYASRIVNFKDGQIKEDSDPYMGDEQGTDYQLNRTSMNYLTALKLSGKNIATKKWRTGLTAFAASIGIIGIALILSLSSGFQEQIDKFQSDALSEFPITISKQGMTMDEETLKEMQSQGGMGKKEMAKGSEVVLYHPEDNNLIHSNDLSDAYLSYLDKMDPQLLKSIGYTRLVGMNVIRQIDDKVESVSVPVGMSGGSSSDGSLASMDGAGLASYPVGTDGNISNYLKKNYDVLEGAYPKNERDLIVVVDHKNRVDSATMAKLGFETKDKTKINFADIVGTEFELVKNDDYYEKTAMGNFMPKKELKSLYGQKENVKVKISGILRQKADVQVGMLGNGLAYSDALVDQVLATEKNSEIVKEQKEQDYNVITMAPFKEDEKSAAVTYLGGDSTPMMVYIYPTDFDAKESIIHYLDSYNKGKDKKETVVYSDLAKSMTDMTGGIMNGITMVLVAFASISLVVSLIMVGIITYISVLERTKEIGVLRALGARKKDITRVFNAETLIIGLASGVLGIAIAYLLTIPVNAVLLELTGLVGIAKLQPLHAISLVTISVILTLLGGSVPAKMAAKKDPVEALRSE